MRQDQFDLATRYLDDALTTLQGVYGPDPSARKARGYFHAEAKKTFIGEPYERSRAYIYRGILYWMSGEPDNARACFRSAEIEDSDTLDRQYAGDWVLPDWLLSCWRCRRVCLPVAPPTTPARVCRKTAPSIMSKTPVDLFCWTKPLSTR